MTGTLVAVCVVHELVEGHSRMGRTAIDKRPVDGPVEVTEHGLAGDTRYNVADHGSTDQAVYAYSRDEAAYWTGELGITIAPGRFGENFAVAGVPVTDAVIGERWLVGGTVLLEVTAPRTPCATFASWMAQPQWVKRFGARADLGCYLRVLTPGAVRAGDRIEVLDRPAHGVTARDVYTATEQDPERLRRLLDESEYVAAKTEARVRRALEGASATR